MVGAKRPREDVEVIEIDVDAEGSEDGIESAGEEAEEEDRGNGRRGREGAQQPAMSARTANAVLAARDGCVAPLTVVTVDVMAVTHDGANRTPLTAKDDPVICVACDVRQYATGAAAGAARGRGPRVVFLVTGEQSETLNPHAQRCRRAAVEVTS